MTNKVDPDEIAVIVGTKRHPKYHIGKADKESETMYIMHSRKCVRAHSDLRTCEFSRALDAGLPDKVWTNYQDDIVLLGIMNERLIPAARLNENWECVGF